MKKILLVLWILFLSFNSYACEFHNGKEYTKNNKSITNIPNIMEFFSFFCPYCYEFEKTHNINNLLKNNINQSIKIEKYHVNFLGGQLSSILTKSWIIAQQIGIEQKIILPIFKAIQETHTINNITNIKQIFKKEAGIDEKKFNSYWNSLTLEILVQKKNKDIIRSKLDHVPSMLINGQYIIDYSKIENIFKDNFTQKYIKLIRFLIKQKSF